MTQRHIFRIIIKITGLYFIMSYNYRDNNSYNYTGYALNNDNYLYLSQNIVSLFVSLLIILNTSKAADYLLSKNISIEKPE